MSLEKQVFDEQERFKLKEGKEEPAENQSRLEVFESDVEDNAQTVPDLGTKSDSESASTQDHFSTIEEPSAKPSAVMSETTSRVLTSRNAVFLGALLAAGAFLRVLILNAGIDLDETVTVHVVSTKSFLGIINEIKTFEFSPPVYFLIMSLWVQAFGDSTVSLAIPSMVCGTLLIPAVYFLARELFDRDDIALTSAVFATISPMAVFFSREARTYSLLALVVTLTSICFLRCLKRTNTGSLISLGLMTTLLLYCHYFAMFLVGIMGLDTLFYAKSPTKSPDFKCRPILITFFLSVLAFLPWLPVFLAHRSVGTFWKDTEPITNWPFIFTNNLAATLPLPWVLGFIILSIALPIIAGLALWKLFGIIRKHQLKDVLDCKKVYVFLLINSLIPAAAIGYVVPFITGYARYIMSFIVFAWILWAAFFVNVVSRVGSRLGAPTWSSISVSISIIVLLAVPSTLDYLEVKGWSQGQRSGLRQFAHDWQAGKFKNSALLMAPDFDSFTLIYYLTREQKGAIPNSYYTFPRQPTLTPAKHIGYAESFRDPACVTKAMEWIASLDKNQNPELVVVQDINALDSALMPAKTKVKELLETIGKRYPAAGKPLDYKSQGRSFQVHRFTL